MTYQAFEETGTGIVEVENFLDPRVSLGFWQNWGFSQSEAEELDTKLIPGHLLAERVFRF